MPARHTYQRGDVVLVLLPFSNRTGQKTRPSLVISTVDYHDDWDEVIVVGITSQRPRGVRPTDCVLGDWQSAGLHQPSWVRAHVYTVDHHQIQAKIGTLTAQDLAAVDVCLRHAIDL
jgi:mRNA-degrading endonuclease toxin of MazEF toxin-antitoxin module